MAQSAIEKRLEALVPRRDTLSEAMRYALLGPGKRIRPLLVLATAETFGIECAVALDPACAIEMVHAYSLAHDDLPCMDDDEIRRGRPTLHRVYPEGIALLAGDALLTEAFGVLTRAEGLSWEIKGRLIACLSNRAGKEGMAGGQAIDLLSTQPISSEVLFQMHQKKTGDLLSCCFEFGSILSGCNRSIEEEMRSLGLSLGLAYQIRDDLEDGDLERDFGRALLEQSLAEIEEKLALLPGGAPLIKDLLTPLFSLHNAKN